MYNNTVDNVYKQKILIRTENPRYIYKSIMFV